VVLLLQGDLVLAHLVGSKFAQWFVVSFSAAMTKKHWNALDQHMDHGCFARSLPAHGLHPRMTMPGGQNLVWPSGKGFREIRHEHHLALID
jgi:hypothetical protein